MAARRSSGRPVLLLALALACCMSLLSSRNEGSSSFAVGSAGRAGGRAAETRLRAGPVGTAAGQAKLRYFDGRGVAETARMLFALAGEDFEDARYPISFGTPGDFSTIKRDEFDADKAAGKMDIGMGKVPVLEIGDSFAIPQSKAIERYLAKKFGMMGSTPEEEAWVDSIAEHVRDISDTFNRKGLFFMKDQEKKAELTKEWYDKELPEFLGKLEKALPGSSGFAVGSKMSYADVVIFKLLKDTYQDDVASAYSDCPKLKAIVDAVGKEAGLQKWIEERPKTMF